MKVRKMATVALLGMSACTLAACGNSNSQASSGKTSLNLMETQLPRYLSDCLNPLMGHFGANYGWPLPVR